MHWFDVSFRRPWMLNQEPNISQKSYILQISKHINFLKESIVIETKGEHYRMYVSTMMFWSNVLFRRPCTLNKEPKISQESYPTDIRLSFLAVSAVVMNLHNMLS
ncbi:hypothetical protein TNCV_2643111 [Trichonephila clavipes]|nr:hypothetical protein TNCV_2643111 [Trichonephila clavipes]